MEHSGNHMLYGDDLQNHLAACNAICKALAQPERQWVSLTEDEIYTLAAGGYSVETTRLVDKILKGKNP